jgi:hypothetical protein
MIDELEMMWKEVVMTYPSIRLEGLRKTMKKLRMFSVLACDLNQAQAPLKIYAEMEV